MNENQDYMKISTIETGFFKLDGGAMFGVVPKSLWERKHPADESNRCTWSMRCLLIETGNRKILVDTGIGNKQDAKFRSHFSPHGEASLIQSLNEKGIAPGEITDVLLTHMHFDHVGGALERVGEELVPTFPNAAYWSNEKHYNWAFDPNPREKASFLKENFVSLRQSGKMQFIDVQQEDIHWLPDIRLRFVYGHTEAMMLPIIQHEGKTIVYCADLIPSNYHISLPYVMSYDVRPLATLEEKKRLLHEAAEQNWILLFEHDPTMIGATISMNERGRYVIDEEVNI